MQIKIKRLHPEAIMPIYATSGAACFDVCALESARLNEYTNPAATISTGLCIEIPDGHVLLIFSRSGHGFKHNVRLGNCVGVIDSDYRGELLIRMVADQGVYTIKKGERIAQALLLPMPTVEFIEVDALIDSERGGNGFGSTGR